MAFENVQARTPEARRSHSGIFEAGSTVVRDYADYDEMAAATPRWRHEWFKFGRERGGGSFAISHTSRMQLARMEYRTGLLTQGEIPPNSISFAIPLDGFPVFHLGVQLRSREAAVLPSGREYAGFFRGPTRILVVSLDEAFLRNQARILTNMDILPVLRRVESIRYDGFGQDRLANAVGRLIDLTLSAPHLLTHPIAAEHFDDEIASLLLSNVTTAAPFEAPAVRHRAARRAFDYIRANAEEVFTISELCNAIGASQRTLEIGFQELFGMAPKVYLTTLRLHRARRELLGADRNQVSVTDVATHWGFYHFGRFAGAYRQRYGESPNATIRRAR